MRSMIRGSAEATCPYCCHKVQLNSLMFRCSGQQSDLRQTCTRAVNPRQVQYLLNSAPALPAFPSRFRAYAPGQRAECPSCGGVSATRVCPVCHSVLPSTFGEGKCPTFVIVGSIASGKTTYLTVLIHELTTSIRRRFGASIYTIGGSPMIGAVKQFWEAINSGGALPPATNTAAAERPYPIVLD